MTQKKIVSAICPLLILLWVYAAVSKLIDFDQSRAEMLNQVFPDFVGHILARAVPAAEITAALLLIMSRTVTAGLKLSLLLLTAFSVYIALVMLNVFGRIPCSCGGILKEMTWGQHLVFNLFFLMLTLIALLFTIKERRLMGKGF